MVDESKGIVWDLTSFFPEFNGPVMVEFKKTLSKDLISLQKKAKSNGPLTEETITKWEKTLLMAESLSSRLHHLGAYIECLASADATNEAYSREDGELAMMSAEFDKYHVDVLHAFKAAPDKVFKALVAREKLKGMEHSLRRTREISKYTMSRDEEILAADLNVDGFHKWGRLYDTITGKLEFDMIYPNGKKERLPISQWRSLMSNVDFNVGKAAFEGGNKAWQGIEDVCAAALNSISGTRLSLYKHRGIDDFLYMTLFQSNIKKASLDAMYKAIYKNIDVARDILKTKAAFYGRKGIWWFEREAPLALETDTNFPWKQGSAMVGKAFETAYPGLAEYYNSFIKKHWIESQIRPGKRPGAFCTNSSVNNEQRVFMTFNGSIGDVTTLAHEVGHAWHSWLLRDLRPTARRYPMTLAETASIFGEHILSDGVYEDKNISDDLKLLMLNSELNGAAVLILDITTRFEFEKAFYEERKKGEVSVSRLKELMVETQKRILGDSLAKGSEDPLFWASKLHFYITTVSFYNFPYTFGFLLARALFTQFKKEGPGFLPKYEAFLRMTGSDTVENVAKKSIGADTTDPAFWNQSIKSLDESLKLYKQLLAKRKKK